MTPLPRDVPSLLDQLQRRDPGRPRLTWYGEPGERVELSARVLANWVAKSANLLAEEFDAGPGVAIVLDLPPAHWKTLVLGLAVSATGATMTLDDGDVTVALKPGPHVDLVVALGALARRHDGEVGTAIDYAATITGYDDVFIPAQPDTALIPHAARLEAAPGERRLIPADADAPLAHLVALLAVDGSLVVATPEADLARIASQESAVLLS